MKYDGKVVVGLVEEVKINSSSGKFKKLLAKIDTGATKSSIDTRLAEQLELGPVTQSKMIKSAHGNRIRPVIDVEIEMEGKKIKEEFTIADRSHMSYPVLIGQNILVRGFIIDPCFKRKR